MIDFTPSEIASLPLKDAYKAFLLTIEDGDETFEKLYKRVRFGDEIKFDINEYFEGVITLEKSHGVFRHEYRRKKVNITNMFTELEEREKIIKKTLLESLKENPIFDDIEV